MSRGLLAWLAMTFVAGAIAAAVWNGCSGPKAAVQRDPDRTSWPLSAPSHAGDRADVRRGDDEGTSGGEASLAAGAEATPAVSFDTPIPADSPAVRAREAEAEGIRYLEVVLGEVAFDADLPLVVIIHGRGDVPRVPGFPFYGVSEPMRIVMPQAPTPLPEGGYSWLPVVVADGRTAELAAAMREQAARIARLIDHVRRERRTRGAPIVTGFSQGGLLGFALAVHHPEVVGTALPNAGWLPPPLVPEALRPGVAYPRIRSMHGTMDERVPIGPTRESVERLRALGLDVELREMEGVPHTMSPEMNTLFAEWLTEALAERAAPADAAPAAAPSSPEPPTPAR